MGFTFSLFTNFLVWIQYKIYTHRNFNNQFLLLDLLFKLHPPSRLPNVLIPTKKKKKERRIAITTLVVSIIKHQASPSELFKTTQFIENFIESNNNNTIA